MASCHRGELSFTGDKTVGKQVMRTDSADVRPNARLISIKCRIRAVSARVARGERSRAPRGARNLWKFCKWPIRRTKRWRSLGGAVQHGAGPPLPLSPIDGAEKFLRKKDPRQKIWA